MSLSMSFSSLFPINSQLKHCQKKLHYWIPCSGRFLQHNNQRRASLIKTNANNALADDYSLFLGVVTSPSKSGDITVFLQTSAGLFFLYWITNFVVPSLLTKYYQFDKINEDQNQNQFDKVNEEQNQNRNRERNDKR